MDTLVKENIRVLEQTKTVINTLPEGIYSALSDSSIGQHVRHILDHYLALQCGYESNYIDYNSRNRNSIIESDSDAALQLIHEICIWMQQLPSADKSLSINTEISSCQTESILVTSNLTREFCYLLNHSIHHLAYIKLLAKNWNVSFAHELGLAPSTASYMRQQSSN